jgi:hypothetical protein
MDIRIMLFAVESETVSNFMLYALIFIMGFGYWAYRLVYRWLDHTAHKECIGLYSKHFGKHKHLISSFGDGVGNLATTAQSYSFIYSMCTNIFGTLFGMVGMAINPVIDYWDNQNRRSGLLSILNPLVNIIGELCRPAPPAPCTTAPIASFKSARFPKRTNFRRNPYCNKRFRRSPPKEGNKFDIPIEYCPFACPSIGSHRTTSPDIFKEINLKDLPNQPMSSKPSNFTDIAKNIISDMKIELGNDLCLNTYLDECFEYLSSFDWEDQSRLYFNLIRVYSRIGSEMASPDSHLSKLYQAFQEYKANPTKTGLFKGLFQFCDNYKETGKFDMDSYLNILEKLCIKYGGLSIGGFSEIRDTVKTMLSSMNLDNVVKPPVNTNIILNDHVVRAKSLYDNLNIPAKLETPSEPADSSTATGNRPHSATDLDFNSIFSSVFNQVNQMTNSSNTTKPSTFDFNALLDSLTNQISNIPTQSSVTPTKCSSPVPPSSPCAEPNNSLILKLQEELDLANEYQECGAETINYSTLTVTEACTLLKSTPLHFNEFPVLRRSDLEFYPKPNQCVADALRLRCFITLGPETFMFMYKPINRQHQEVVVVSDDE